MDKFYAQKLTLVPLPVLVTGIRNAVECQGVWCRMGRVLKPRCDTWEVPLETKFTHSQDRQCNDRRLQSRTVARENI